MEFNFLIVINDTSSHNMLEKLCIQNGFELGFLKNAII